MLNLRINVKSIGQSFVNDRKLVERADRQAKRQLSRIGAYAMRVTRNSLRPKRDMRVSEFPADLKRLVLGQTDITRTKAGKIAQKQPPGTTQQLRQMVKPWPQVSSVPGKPPKVRSIKTKAGKSFKPFKNLIVFVVDQKRGSVVVGPEVNDRRDVPGVLEHGGTQRVQLREWRAVYVRGRRVVRFVKTRRGAKRYESRPYTGPAFDKTMDALVPQVFQGILK
jgi:hypothetical protein